MVPAMRHPNVPPEPILKRSRRILGVVGIVLFLLTFTATPFYDSSLMHFFHLEPFEAAGR
jgi:multisubunit Na+/H+ antiporter MnhB subunit